VRVTKSFSCFAFRGADNFLALPAAAVLQVAPELHESAPHITTILEVERSETETRILELAGDGSARLFLEVDGPVSVVTYEVKQVVPGSAGQGGPYTSAIINDGDELVLLLDSQKIRSATLELSKSGSAETEATTC
jgi:hypothetical protein